jgi:hypothetical protein
VKKFSFSRVLIVMHSWWLVSQLEPKKMGANAEEEGFNSNQALTTALRGSGKEFKH